jgi:hypothetical protein
MEAIDRRLEKMITTQWDSCDERLKTLSVKDEDWPSLRVRLSLSSQNR